MAVESQRRGGRRSKGDRRYFGTRVALPAAEKLEEVTAATGETISDFIAEAVYERLRKIDLSKIEHQEELFGQIAS